MNLDTLYLFLLNRLPNIQERHSLRHQKIKEINKLIVNSTEYQNFLENNRNFLKTFLHRTFGFPYSDISENIIFDWYNLFRNFQYDRSKLETYCQEKIFLFHQELERISQNIEIDQNELYHHFQAKLGKLISQNKNNPNLEFEIIISDFYLEYCEKKLIGFLC